MSLDAKIAECEAALNDLYQGKAVEMTSYEGFTTKFTPADTQKLEGYIAKLKAQKAGRLTRGARVIRFRG